MLALLEDPPMCTPIAWIILAIVIIVVAKAVQPTEEERAERQKKDAEKQAKAAEREASRHLCVLGDEVWECVWSEAPVLTRSGSNSNDDCGILVERWSGHGTHSKILPLEWQSRHAKSFRTIAKIQGQIRWPIYCDVGECQLTLPANATARNIDSRKWFEWYTIKILEGLKKVPSDTPEARQALDLQRRKATEQEAARVALL